MSEELLKRSYIGDAVQICAATVEIRQEEGKGQRQTVVRRGCLESKGSDNSGVN